jgi:WD40 repeat protein
MLFFRRQDSPGIQLASSDTQQEVISRLASGALLPTDEIFDTEHKKWLPLYEWITFASPTLRTASSKDIPRAHSTSQDTVLPKSQPNAATEETNLGPNSQVATSTAFPSHIGKYPIIKVLGSGGMGTVFEAIHPLTEEKVAIKVIHPHLSSQPKIKSLFLQEAKAAIKFTQMSPHLVTTQDVDEDNGKLFQVLEYIEWDTLLKSQDDVRALGWKEVLELYKQLAHGLVALHQEKVIHRDLKPSNVFIRHHNNQWNIKLADFGLSLSEETTDLQQSMVKQAGTAFYMSPEQRKGEPCTNASDIYSLGVMLYETLTGEKVEGRYDPATEFIQDLPSEVDKIIDACIATNPKKRIQDANQLITSIKAVIIDAERRSQAREADIARQEAEQKGQQKEVERLIQTLAGHTACVRGIAFSPDGNTLASGSLDTTIKLWDVHSGVLENTLRGKCFDIYSVSFSPDGNLLAGGEKYYHKIQLWDINSGTLKTTLGYKLSAQLKSMFSLAAETVNSIAFSPDGNTLASGSSDNTIKFWDVRSETLKTTRNGHSGLVWCVAFSPDGTLLASGGNDRTIKLWEPHDGTLKTTLQGHEDWVFSVAFSPDGITLASGSADKTIKLWDVRSGTLISTLRGQNSPIHSVAFSPDGTLLASGSNNKTIKLWDVRLGTQKSTLQGHTDSVKSVAFSPDGTLLASGSDDKTIKLWRITD